jgi:hypothetical protein
MQEGMLQRRAFSIAAPDHLVGLSRVELLTSRLSGVRSNHLSYRPNSYGDEMEHSHRSLQSLKKVCTTACAIVRGVLLKAPLPLTGA